MMVAAKAGTVKAEEARNDRHETMPVVPTVGFGQPGAMLGRSRRSMTSGRSNATGAPTRAGPLGRSRRAPSAQRGDGTVTGTAEPPQAPTSIVLWTCEPRDPGGRPSGRSPRSEGFPLPHKSA